VKIYQKTITTITTTIGRAKATAKVIVVIFILNLKGLVRHYDFDLLIV
jgi:hypothetical protein